MPSTLKLFDISKADGLQGTFYFNNGDLNSAIGTTILMTDLTWDIRDPYTGTIDEKIQQWLVHLKNVMNKTVDDDFHIFPVVVSFKDNDNNMDISKPNFIWLNGIEASDNGMVLIANNPQMELSQDSGITLTLSDPTIKVTLPSAVTEETTVIIHYLIGSLNNGENQHAGRKTLVFEIGQSEQSFNLTIGTGQHIIYASVVYINPTTDTNAVYQSNGYGVTPFLKTSYVLRQVFKYFGYNLLENIFDTDPVLKYRVELNNTADAILPGTIDFSQLVPDATVSDYLDSIRIRFGIEFVPDSQKNIMIWSWNEAIDSVPDFDLTPYLSGLDKIEWQPAEPLQLSDSKSINLAATSQDTFELFLKKYKSYSVFQLGASSIIPDGVIFHAATNSFYSDLNRLGSSAFDIIPTGDQTESISAKDAIVPTICVNPGGTIYCPFINSRRHLNTTVEYGTTVATEDDVTLDIMGCFALPSLQQSFQVGASAYQYVFKYYMGTQTCYDGSGNKWGSLSNQFWGDEGTFQQCYLKKDQIKRNSYHKITVNLKLDFLTLYNIVQKIHTKKLYKNQSVLIESLTADISDRLDSVEIILRTTRQYINTSEGVATWYWSLFVCELTSAALESNVISASFSGTDLTVHSEQAVASDVVVKVDWIASFTDSSNPDNDTQSTGSETITIPAGQTSVTVSVSSEVNSNEELVAATITSVTPTYDNTFSYYGNNQSQSATSGFQRTLNICVILTYDNDYESDNNYDGKQSFIINGNTYSAITDNDLQVLALSKYTQRLTDWIAFFNANYLSLFPGLNVDADGARVYNLSSCPI
jgi:hypothetical protein